MSRFITAKMAFPMLMVLMSMMMMLATRSEAAGLLMSSQEPAHTTEADTCFLNNTNTIGFYEVTESAFQVVPADNSGVIPVVVDTNDNKTYVIQPGFAGPYTLRLFVRLPEGGFRLVGVCTLLYYAPDRASCSDTLDLGTWIFQGIFDQNCAVTGMVGHYAQPPGQVGLGGIVGTANGEALFKRV